jgi:hypothetical protein
VKEFGGCQLETRELVTVDEAAVNETESSATAINKSGAVQFTRSVGQMDGET